MTKASMQRLVVLLWLALVASNAHAQAPLYGKLDMVGVPRPEVIEPRPVSAERAQSNTPVYVRARPGEEKHWKRNCAQYKACNVPVYFVRDDWYRRVYEPRLRAGEIGSARNERTDRKKTDVDDDDDEAAERPTKSDAAVKKGAPRRLTRDHP